MGRKLVFLQDSPSLIQVDEAVAILQQHGLETTRTLGPDDAQDVVAVVVGLGRFTTADAERFPRLATVAQFGAGTDNIDVRGLWAKRGLPVSCTPNLSNRHVAELALAMLILALRGAPQDVAGLKSDPFAWRQIPRGRGMSESTIGIVGCGNIGLEAARLIAPLAERTLLWNRTPRTIHLEGVETSKYEVISTLEELAARADAITVHLALTDTTRGLIGAEFFDHIKQAGRHMAVVNTSRGTIVDETALLAALENRSISAAAIDVWSAEGPNDSEIVRRLRTHPGVLPTSHIGAFTQGVQHLYAVQVALNIAAAVEGRLTDITPYLASAG
jgi:D-3-phosphoglycerate dehydrogenase